jgi:hypothetical protein
MNASPSSHSIRIGDYTVTAFSDGEFETKLDVAVGIDPESLQRITGKTPMDLIEIAVNVYLLEGRGIRALVDAGSGLPGTQTR